MNISDLSGVDLDSVFQSMMPKISSSLASELNSSLVEGIEGQGTFQGILDSAMGLVGKANAYSNAAEEEEIRYAEGESDSLHNLMIAQQKANVALQYTVAVRDAFISGYKELMNIQF